MEGLTKVKKEGSLFNWLDNTKTAFGRRLLKKWICSPLNDITKINIRLDAIEDLIGVSDTVFCF